MTDKDEIWRRLANEKARGAEYDSNERRQFSQCIPGTRVELLNQLESAMTQEDSKIVWLFGDSGSGKSSVAYSLAERLRTKERLAATFFFSRKHVSRSNTEHVLPTLAYQIGLLHHRAKEVIVKAIRDDPELLSPEKSRRSQFESLVVAPLRELHLVWGVKRTMIFDAVDEGKTTHGCEPAIRLLVSMFADLVRDANVPISTILCTSRPLPSLESLPQRIHISDSVTSLDVESFDASHDVQIFLRHSFRDIYEMREVQFAHPLPWPSETVLNVLLGQVKGHFIVAATIVRLVGDASDPTSCINTLANMYQGDVRPLDLSLGNIDSVYRYILSGCDPQDRRTGAECLSDIIALAEPLCLSNICKLATRDVRKQIIHLSAVIFIPPMDSTETVQIYHSSLRDFLADSSRSSELHVEPAESHRRLACSCFRIMQRELKKDICGLGDPSKLQFEIEDFDQRRSAAISGALRYACLYWTYHLERAGQNAEVQALVLHFLQTQLLFFLEVSSVMGYLHLAATCLLDARRVVQGWESFVDQELASQLLYDAWRLVLEYSEPIRESALHVYESALPMCPSNAPLRLMYQEIRAESTVSVELGLDSYWGFAVRTIPHEYVSSVKMSPDGLRVATFSNISHVKISSDGREQGTCSGLILKLWDTISGAFIASPDSTVELDCVAFSHNGTILACQGSKGRACLWYPQSNSIIELLTARHDLKSSRGTPACALSYDDSVFASCTSHHITDSHTIVHLFDCDTTRRVWTPRAPIVVPHVGIIDDLVFSREGLLIVRRHFERNKRFSFPSWHAFTYAGDTTLHVEQIGPNNSEDNMPHLAHINTHPGHDAVLFCPADDAVPIRLPDRIRTATHAILIGDYIYTRDRQIHVSSQAGHGHFLSAAIVNGKALIVDLSLLIQAQAHRRQHLEHSKDIFQLLCSRPDTKQAVIARSSPGHPVNLHTAHDVMSGWAVVTLTGSICDAPGLITVSYNMDLFASLSASEKIIRVYGIDGQEVCALSPQGSIRPSAVKQQQFSPKSTYFCFSADERLWIWATGSGRLLGVIDSFFGVIFHAPAFSDDETRLAVVENPAIVTLHSVGTSITPIVRVRIPVLSRPINIYTAFTGSQTNLDILTYADNKTTLWQYRAGIPGVVPSATHEMPHQYSSSTLLSSPRLRRLRCWNLLYGPSVKSDTVNALTTPGNHSASSVRFEVDSTCSPTAIVDIHTWSKVLIDAGWIISGSRRICWLSPRYRPVQLGKSLLSVFADRVLFRIYAPPGEYRDKPMVLCLRGVEMFYYDWSTSYDDNSTARHRQVVEGFYRRQPQALCTFSRPRSSDTPSQFVPLTQSIPLTQSNIVFWVGLRTGVETFSL